MMAALSFGKITCLINVLLGLSKPEASANDEFGEQIIPKDWQSSSNDSWSFQGLSGDSVLIHDRPAIMECSTNENEISVSTYGRLSPIHSLKWKVMLIYVNLEFKDAWDDIYYHIIQAQNALNKYLAPCGAFIGNTLKPPDPKYEDYVEVISGDGCWSDFIGRKGGKQTISLNIRGCNSYGIVLHEIMHALGFHHTHIRPDRDEHVTVLWENIEANKVHNFKITSASDTTTYGITYNYRSVMHYSSKAFSVNNKETLRAKDGRAIGTDNEDPLKASDINMLVLHYCTK